MVSSDGGTCIPLHGNDRTHRHAQAAYSRIQRAPGWQSWYPACGPMIPRFVLVSAEWKPRHNGATGPLSTLQKWPRLLDAGDGSALGKGRGIGGPSCALRRPRHVERTSGDVPGDRGGRGPSRPAVPTTPGRTHRPIGLPPQNPIASSSEGISAPLPPFVERALHGLSSQSAYVCKDLRGLIPRKCFLHGRDRQDSTPRLSFLITTVKR